MTAMTHAIKSILDGYTFTVEFSGSFKGEDEVVFVRASDNYAWFGSVTEMHRGRDGAEYPKIRGCKLWSEILPELDEPVARAIRAVIEADKAEAEARREAKELEKAEASALKALKAADKMFSEPKLKAAESMRGWRIDGGKAWSPNGRPWDIESVCEEGWVIHSRKSERQGILTRHGNYKPL